MKVQVDTGSSINFLPREVAINLGLEIQSLGSEPLQCVLAVEYVVLDEYVELTLVDEDREDQRHIRTTFYIFPSKAPSTHSRITMAHVGCQFLQEFGHVLLDEDPRNPVLSTKMGRKNVGLPIRTRSYVIETCSHIYLQTYMEEQRQEKAKMIEAYEPNASFEKPDRPWTPPSVSHEAGPAQIQAQALTVEPQESYQPRTPIAKDTPEQYAPTICSSDLSLGSSEPTQIFSAGHSVSTKPTAASKTGINDRDPHPSRYDDTATNYTSPWKEHPYSKALIRGLAQHLNEEAKSFSRDESVLDRISAALPDLVRAFALRLGYSPRSADDRDVALFVRRNRL